MTADNAQQKNITEKQIDRLLVDEFNSNSEFAHWFAHQAITQLQNNQHKKAELAKHFENKPPVKARLSVVHIIKEYHLANAAAKKRTYMESDILVIYGIEKPVWLMIENKISAVLTDEQGKGYRSRGGKARKFKHNYGFITVIIAPGKYLETFPKTAPAKVTALSNFDVKIAYEAIADWFEKESGLGERGLHKAHLLKQACA